MTPETSAAQRQTALLRLRQAVIGAQRAGVAQDDIEAAVLPAAHRTAGAAATPEPLLAGDGDKPSAHGTPPPPQRTFREGMYVHAPNERWIVTSVEVRDGAPIAWIEPEMGTTYQPIANLAVCVDQAD